MIPFKIYNPTTSPVTLAAGGLVLPPIKNGQKTVVDATEILNNLGPDDQALVRDQIRAGLVRFVVVPVPIETVAPGLKISDALLNARAAIAAASKPAKIKMK